MALLLIILTGLFALRRNGGATSMFGLARLLWTQVRRRFSSAFVRLIFLKYSPGCHLARTWLRN